MLIGSALLLLLLIALLAIPVGLEVDLHGDNEVRGSVHLLWAFGLVNLALVKRPPGPAKKPGGHKKAGSRPPRNRGDRESRFTRALRQRSFRRRLFRLGRDAYASIRFREFSVNLRIGLGDPAETGQLWALLGPFAGFLSTLRRLTVRLTPDFQQSVLAISSQGQIWIVPLRFIVLGLGLLLSPSFWNGLSNSSGGVTS